MARLKQLIDRAREAAQSRLPEEVLDAGRRLRDTVVEHAPVSVREVIERYVPASPGETGATTEHREEEDLDDAAVIVYATTAEAESVRNIRDVFRRHDIRVREVDLESIPKMARQIAQVTNVFVPPYVFIGGRFWGAEFDMLALEAQGDLVKVVEGRIDEISEEARRIGRVRDSFSDALTADNILDRLRLGHILCIDDLDCWYEQDRTGERFFYQGAPRPVAEMPEVAQQIARAAEADAEFSGQWRFEPEVRMN